ncbi:MAG: hypothetical protein H6531_09640 [Actinobacteria bacterium]|nr:hypothetical protein [Thermoleophilia bacterium]MCB9012076.1 hypothetical protein [Actinomycetota bacterium]
MTGSRLLPAALAAGAFTLVAASSAAAVTPELSCVTPHNGAWLGYFGYSNPSSSARTIGIGSNNRFRPGPSDVGQPVRFEPDTAPVGDYTDTRTQIVVGAPFSRSTTWELDGARATADRASDRCRFDLGVSIRTDRPEVHPGEKVTWIVALSNAGASPMPRNQIVFDTVDLPPLAIDEIPPDELMPGEGIYYWGITRPRVSDCGEEIRAEARVSIGPGVVVTPDSNAANDRAAASFSVACDADLALQATADAAAYSPGQVATYTFTVTNTGDISVPSDTVTVSDPTLTNITPVGIPPARLQPQESLTFTATRAITADMCDVGATIQPTAGFTTPSLTDANPQDNTATVTVTVTGGACTAVPEPPPPVIARNDAKPSTITRLRVEVTGRTLGTVGRAGTYRFRVRNVGRHTAHGIVVTAAPPPGSAIVRRRPGVRVRHGRVVLRIPALRPRGTRVFTVRVRYTQTTPRRRQAVVVARATNAPTTRDALRVRVRPRAVRVAQQLPPVTG